MIFSRLRTSCSQPGLALCLILITLAACSTDADPAQSVEDYLQAKAKGDAQEISRLLCAEMEEVLELEQMTFVSVSQVEIEGMSCEQVGGSNTVRCEGKIVALYGTEQTEFPLVSYRVVEEDGEWKWCGEAP